jgi:hypothetical protein
LAVHRRVAAVANWCFAGVAAASLLLVPVTTAAGTDADHAHALLQVVVDLADGSYDHHDSEHHHGHDVEIGHADADADRPGSDPGAGSDPAHGARSPQDHEDGHDDGAALAAAARGRSTPADAVAADIDGLPIVTAFSPTTTAGAMPLAPPLVRTEAPSPGATLLLWVAVAVPSGVALDPLSPPPRAGSPA